LSQRRSRENAQQLAAPFRMTSSKNSWFRKYYIYLPKVPCESSAISSAIAREYAQFNCISVERIPHAGSGATADIELAYTLADGLEYCARECKRPRYRRVWRRVSPFSGHWHEPLMEIAKMRAARMLWAKLVKTFNPKNPKSLVLRTHCRLRWSLTAQDPTTMWCERA